MEQQLQQKHMPVLPAQITLAMMPWLASNAILRLSKSELGTLSQLSHRANQSGGEFNQLWQRVLSDPQLAKNVEQLAKKRLEAFLQGVERYQKGFTLRRHQEFACVYETGCARLLDAGGKSAYPAVLLVPSLINRYYILDLTKRLSFARYLRDRGLRVFIVDWGVPGKPEEGFNCADYITERLIPLAKKARDIGGSKLIAAGYCMGGIFTLALAIAEPKLVGSLACFATPWDFMANDFPKILLPEEEIEKIRHYLSGCRQLPADVIHSLFQLANPFAYQQKFQDFHAMPAASQEEEDFYAIEGWVQDGVPMTAQVAEDCLIGWAHHNTLANLEWKIDGSVVNPERIMQPAFVAVPKGDRIVPSGSALPLAALLPNRILIQPNCGHVGMMVGKRRRADLWQPFADWAMEQEA